MRPHLTSEQGFLGSHKRPALTGKGQGVGVHRVPSKLRADRNGGRTGTLTQQIPALGGDSGARGYLRALSDRLRRVRVCCGDWQRVIGPAVTTCIATTGVFLDPPYHGAGTGRSRVYNHDADGIFEQVHAWAVQNGDSPELRIALCGYEGPHQFPDGWTEVVWKAAGGYEDSERGRKNRGRERIWFSPHCLQAEQMELI